MTALVGPIRVVWSWRDETGSSSKPRTHLRQAAIADAAADAVSLASAAVGVSRCVLEGFSLNYTVVNPDAGSPGGQSVKVLGVLVFKCGDDPERLFYEQPGLVAELISDVPPYVDVAADDPRIVAMADAIISNGFCNPNGELATELIAVLWRQDT